jgi:serine kinase of HPr protein (carbohydrate metabolism regulator)
MTAQATLHASCVVVRETGILIRGPSGSGKSSLARRLLSEGERLGRFARLVCDDRVRIENRNGRVAATAVPAIGGMIEVRGMGLLTLPYERSAIVGLVIDLTGDPPRLPEAAERTVTLCGVPLPRIEARIEPGLPQAILLRLDHPR